jgi:hypothetical protein
VMITLNCIAPWRGVPKSQTPSPCQSPPSVACAVAKRPV